MLKKRILLPGDALTDAYSVRMSVFVEEQGFSPDIEVDDTDPVAYHVVFFDDGCPVATGRTFPNADKPSEYVIGRVAVLENRRGTGLGYTLMEALETLARELGAKTVSLCAQCQARGFYEKCGYEASGDLYYEEHCPHVHMEKKLREKTVR